MSRDSDPHAIPSNAKVYDESGNPYAVGDPYKEAKSYVGTFFVHPFSSLAGDSEGPPLKPGPHPISKVSERGDRYVIEIERSDGGRMSCLVPKHDVELSPTALRQIQCERQNRPHERRR